MSYCIGAGGLKAQYEEKKKSMFKPLFTAIKRQSLSLNVGAILEAPYNTVPVATNSKLK